VANFSASEAIGAGFRVIRRTPWVILAWALAYLVLAVPQFAVYAAAAPSLVAYYQALAHAAQSGAPPTAGPMLAFQQQMMSVQAVGMLTSIVVNTILTAAIYRAVLEPQARRWAYLRLSAQELWLALATAVLMILLMLMIFALVVPVAISVAVTAAAVHAGRAAGGGGLLIGVACGVGVAAIVWALLRLSLALPMSFAERKFLLFESWALTRGQAGKMFLVALALLAIVWVLEIVVLGLFWWGVFSFGGLDLAALPTTPAPELVRRLIPAFLLLLPVMAVFGMALLAVMLAPWADIYRQLTREDAAA
jgi:hypothetical protein